MKFIKKYIDKYLAPEIIGKFFDDLARGKYPITTNQYLKWCLVFTTTTFSFFYFKGILSAYIFHHIGYSKILEQEPALIIPVACKLYVNQIKLQGMSIKSFEILLELISIIRFIFIAIRFNIPTSFVITTISYLAAYVWYVDGIMNIYNYSVFLKSYMPTNYSTLLGEELQNYRKAYIERSLNNFPNILSKVRSSYFKAFTVYFYEESDFNNWLSINEARLSDTDPTNWSSLNNGQYLNDPVSMITRFFVERLPLKNSESMVATYYLVREKYFTNFYNFVGFQLRSYRNFILYVYIVRKCKNYMPYLIRWHWTLCLLIHPFIDIFLKRGVVRLDYYNRSVLKKAYKDAVREMLPQPYIEAARFKTEVVQYCIFTTILVCLVFYFFAALHAVCGQYFFVPLITKNTELHVGYRVARSFYSGGLTSWQDLEPDSSKLWHGVFGRGTDKVPVILTIFDFIKNLFIRFFKLFKR